MMRGCFVTFEGGEGVGKTTLINALKAKAEAVPREFVFTREPGGSRRAEALREVLLGHSDANDPMSAETEALIICAARSDHVDATIRPALSRGAVVMCDRFSDSTRAYQGQRADASLIEASILLATKGLEPDLTILLDGDPEKLLQRRADRAGPNDRFELKDLSFHRDVRQAFLKTAETFQHRFEVLNAEEDTKTIQKKTVDILNRRFDLGLAS